MLMFYTISKIKNSQTTYLRDQLSGNRHNKRSALRVCVSVEVLVVGEVFGCRRNRMSYRLPGYREEEGRDRNRDVCEYEDRERKKIQELLDSGGADLLPFSDDGYEAHKKECGITFSKGLTQ